MSKVLKESGHWYTKEGEPAYTQIIKSGVNKGNERNTTVADARKLGLVPSVTTITSVLDKGGLNFWLQNRAAQAAEYALATTLNDTGVITDADFSTLCITGIVNKLPENNAAEIGTAIHGGVQDWIETGSTAGEWNRWYKPVKEVFESLGVTSPVSERSFSNGRFAGAVDLHDFDNNIIIDFKTKDFTKIDDVFLDKNGKKVTKFHSDENGMQLAAYGQGLKMNNPKTRYFNLFLSRQDPDIYILHEWKQDDIELFNKMFTNLVDYFWLSKRLP